MNPRRALLGSLLTLSVVLAAAPPSASAAISAAPVAPAALTKAGPAVPPPAATLDGAARVEGARHGMGLLPPRLRISASAQLMKLRAAKGRQALAAPASVDLSADAPPVGNQGQIGSCVAWTIGYGIAGYYSKAQPHSGAPFAALSLYNQINGGQNRGTTSTAAYSVMKDVGIVEKSAWTHSDTDFVSKPAGNELVNASAHRTTGGSYLFVNSPAGPARQALIQDALAAGKPVALGIPVYNAFNYLSATDSVMTKAKVSGSVLGGHLIAAYGYDATGVKVENSWGTGWGKAGWATLSWDFVNTYVNEASTPGTFVSVTAAGVPTITEVTPRTSLTAGGGTVTVRGTNLADLAASHAVQLVNTQDPSKTYDATVTTASGVGLLATLPAVPAQGTYRLVVTNSFGSSADTAADDVTYVTKPAFTISPVTVPATSGAEVTLSGSGFGANAAEFAALGYTATVDGKTARLTWVSAGAVKVLVPAGSVGKQPSIVLARAGFSSDPNVTSVRYGASIATASATADAAGTVLRISGKGLAGSTGWTLTSDADPSVTVALPARSDLTAVGVVVSGDTAAAVRLPLAPGAAGAYHLTFTPSSSAYPGAGFADTPAAHVPYKLPTLTANPTPRVSTAGGARIVLKGKGLLAVDPADSTAVSVVNVADPSKKAAVQVVERTDASLTLTMPAAPAAAGVPVEGEYRIVVKSPLGTATAAAGADVVTYLKPYGISVASGTKVPAAGNVPVVVQGSGFGTTKTEFGAAKVTATVNGRGAPVAWISDTKVSVGVPQGVPGTLAKIVLLRSGVASASVDVPYVATITRLSVPTGPASGGTVVAVTGKGFAGSSTWALKGSDGSTVASLPTVSSLDGVSSGVVVLSDTRVAVRMPALGSAFGTVVLAFTPDQALYPGAASAFTSQAVFTYSDLG